MKLPHPNPPRTEIPLDFTGRCSHIPRNRRTGVDQKMTWLLQFFTWWSGQTLNTRFHTWRKGERVGSDDQGNVYYRTKGGAIDPVLGFERRWVIYNGESEASKVPPGWYGWLHHSTNVSPAAENYKAHEWEMPHVANMTGTPHAYRPEGSAMNTGKRPAATGDYQAWTPG